MRDRDSVYLQKLHPPIDGLIKDVKHIPQTTSKPAQKELALKRLRDAATEVPEALNPSDADPEPFTIQEVKQIAEGHVVLHGIPDIKPWDMVRYVLSVDHWLSLLSKG